VHGDVWAGNILVDGSCEALSVSGWLDPWLLFADIEYELAYISVFGTGGEAFFQRYYASSPPRPGYEFRRLYYWLNTMLVHAWVFGYARYVERAEELAVELTRALG
jgi:fructosamine-3-kinase